MRRALLLLALGAVACAEARPPVDGAGGGETDAQASDARDDAPDVGRCVDRDGDGHEDVSCGGDDCDDADATVSPMGGPCADPVAVVRCVGGSLERVACPTDSPECDARTGQCVPSGEACGDGVVHSSERCDDANEVIDDGCDVGAGCLWGRCVEPSDCPPSAAYCSDTSPGPGMIGRCAPGHPDGEPDGAPCASDDVCASSLCDLGARRCTQTCGAASADCGDALRWCSLALIDRFASLTTRPPSPALCERECRSQADCAPTHACTLMSTNAAMPHHVRAACRPRDGAAPVGASCDGVRCATNNCLDDVCTAVCVEDSDCPPSLPFCVTRDFSAKTWLALGPRGAPWDQEYPRICAAARP